MTNRIIYAALCFALLAVPAAAQELRVKNGGDDPIYKIFAWATDLTPSTENVIVFPLQKGEIDTVDIENDWSDCVFTFMVDRNDPADEHRKFYIKKEVGIYEINICHLDGKPVTLD